MKHFTLDELLLYQQTKSTVTCWQFAYRHGGFLLICMVMAIFGAILAADYDLWFGYISLGCGQSGIIGWGIYVCCLDGRQSRIIKSISDRLHRVPLDKAMRAMKMGGDDWPLAAIECEESHLPGDCLLCGA